MIQSMLAAVLLAQGAQPPAEAATRPGALSLIAGDFQIVNGRTGEVVQDCAQAQRFEVRPDGRNVILTDVGVADWSANYTVLHSEPNRLLLYIEGEDRTTDAGDPVLWWAYFEGRDEFRWRRYDWPRDEATEAVWRRCPRG